MRKLILQNGKLRDITPEEANILVAKGHIIWCDQCDKYHALRADSTVRGSLASLRKRKLKHENWT